MDVNQESKDDKSNVTPRSQRGPLSKKSIGDASDRGPITGFGAASRKMGTTGMGSMGKKKTILTKVQKIHLWEQMVKSYMRDGMVTLQEIKKQSETVTDCLNYCQSQFIQFLERPDSKQNLIDDFTKNFNQFASEFPDLRKDDQAKEELLNRVQNLSNNLWMDIIQRKDESLEDIQTQAEEGWSLIEMKNVVKNMANLIEIEIKKYSIIYQLLLDQEPSVELDAEILVKKLLERGTKPYDAETKQSVILN